MAKRRRGDECNERLVLIVQDSSLDLAELTLEDVFDSLRLDAVATHLELRVNSAEEVNTPRLDVDLALVSRAVEAAELRMGDELLGGLLRLVAIPARDVHPTDAEFANLAMRQWSELVDLEDDVGDVGKR